MRANPLRAGIERGEPQIGTWVNLDHDRLKLNHASAFDHGLSLFFIA
jgi:hypothetical protein